jgi:hypothetical protein
MSTALVSGGGEWPVTRVRDTFIQFFKEKSGHEHTFVPSSPVAPLNDPVRWEVGRSPVWWQESSGGRPGGACVCGGSVFHVIWWEVNVSNRLFNCEMIPQLVMHLVVATHAFFRRRSCSPTLE